ncbi:GNAT family N-acetyltransferase [Flavobacterium wongokense]|uniref:GNAT family N-acetyltransferase n=1 Tax=Flavobacterium wongokense TaxID=2910674 RepID=UPI001F28678B|nr:GNAT family protein [Flavobacterium sp. WG47]MCF6131540.1 GNAT family N-acetyltransferase [Flavobacterium sp. WG47]
MKFENWKIESIANILPEEFFNLIGKNKSHIEKTFPVTVSNCLDLEKTNKFIADNIQKETNNDGYYFYIRNTETHILIGYICIKNIKQDIRKCELAYFIDADFEGRGIISKVVSQTIEFCFTQLQMNKVFLCTSKINKGSQRIALKHGFTEEGILREEFKNHEGVLEDVVYFGLLKSEYNER